MRPNASRRVTPAGAPARIAALAPREVLKEAITVALGLYAVISCSVYLELTRVAASSASGGKRDCETPRGLFACEADA